MLQHTNEQNLSFPSTFSESNSIWYLGSTGRCIGISQTRNTLLVTRLVRVHILESCSQSVQLQYTTFEQQIDTVKIYFQPPLARTRHFSSRKPIFSRFANYLM
jgi:hypothetical protein